MFSRNGCLHHSMPQYRDLVGAGIGENGVFGMLLKLNADKERAIEIAGASM